MSRIGSVHKSSVNMNSNLQFNLDLLVSTMDIYDIIEYRVSDETWGSDHFPLFFYVNMGKFYYEKKPLKSSRFGLTGQNSIAILVNNMNIFYLLIMIFFQFLVNTNSFLI